MTESAQSNDQEDVTFQFPTAIGWKERVPASDNPWTRFAAHIVWSILDLVAEERLQGENFENYDHEADADQLVSEVTQVDQPHAESSQTENLAERFRKLVVIVVKRRKLLAENMLDTSEKILDTFRVRDWALDERTAWWFLDGDMLKDAENLLHRECVSLLYDLESESELCEPLLTEMVDETRTTDSEVALGAADFEEWVSICRDFRAELRGQQPVYRLVEILERWLHQALLFSNRASKSAAVDTSTFRPILADRFESICEEVQQEHGKSVKKQLSDKRILEVLKFLAKDNRHLIMNWRDVRQQLHQGETDSRTPSSKPGQGIGESTTRQICKALTELKYADNGPFRES